MIAIGEAEIAQAVLSTSMPGGTARHGVRERVLGAVGFRLFQRELARPLYVSFRLTPEELAYEERVLRDIIAEFAVPMLTSASSASTPTTWISTSWSVRCSACCASAAAGHRAS
jgi:hypothetical protein